MLRFLRNKVYPIGIDLGSSSLKMVQLRTTESGLGLVAAGKRDVPHDIQEEPAQLQEWYIRNIKELLAEKPFKGKRVVTCLPARDMLVQHMRMAKMDEAQTEKALPWEARDKVPFDVSQALLRHVIAGEIYESNECKQEVILMAASREAVERHLYLIERTKVEIDYVNVEPCALVSCFAHLIEENKDKHSAAMFIDLGHVCTKVVVAHGTKIVFCRNVRIAAENIRRSLCEKLGVDYFQAVQYHTRLQPQMSPPKPAAPLAAGSKAGSSGCAVAADPAEWSPDAVSRQSRVDEIITQTLDCLSEEIRGCIRYHDLLFNSEPIRNVVFLGGQSKNRMLSQKLARNLGLPAQLGDPLGRIDPQSRTGSHSDVPPGETHSDWAVAFGLSLGGVDAG